ncbi:Ribosomal protein s24e family protein [Thalictrum thalictroides]|uniref:Ribosomal protein s24e family protein n=1 Tax=Thalictrum thalictroides TaxID=46969 RepID=A0A7J6USD8_THATH|nr:Ribosomal protein s24e family protein [Thalictrum thalictroides]
MRNQQLMITMMRNVINRSSNSLPRLTPNHHFSFNHFFSTSTTEGGEQQQPPLQDFAVDSILKSSETGLVYAKLAGFGNHTLKTDIINALEGCNLSPQDMKVEYNPYFQPVSMVVRFSNRSAFDNASKIVRRKQLYKWKQVDHDMWGIPSYEGKTVLLQGLPRFASIEDIERFLSGCDFNHSNLDIFLRQGNPDPVKFALVQFPSKIQAMNAVLLKNKSFCQNDQISMRVLH